MAVQKTYIMIKPDGVQRGFIGDIISRFERKGLKLVAMKFSYVSLDQVNEHYGFLKEKSFYKDLVSYITSGPVVKMAWEGENAVSHVRALVGATNPLEATAGTIRSDFGLTTGFNVIHASDSPETGLAEIKRFFSDDELITYSLASQPWLG